MAQTSDGSDNGSGARKGLTVHGGNLNAAEAVFGDPGPQGWLDLSTGINPDPWPIPVLGSDRVLGSQVWTRLPDPSLEQGFLTAFRAAEAPLAAPPLDCLMAVPGLQAALQLLPPVLAARKERDPASLKVLVAHPSYGGHREGWAAWGCAVKAVRDPLDDPALDDADIVVLVHPNNPDGRRWPLERVQALGQQLARKDGCVLLDEAYVAPGEVDSLLCRVQRDTADGAGLIVLRSFGKFFGLPGIRLGVVAAAPDLIAALRIKMGAWPVSGPALAIGTAAHADLDWIARTKHGLVHRRDITDRVLAEAGLDVGGGTDLFCLVQHPHAGKIFEQLGRCGVLVRAFTPEMGSSLLRFGLPSEKAMDRFVTVLSKLHI
ncbi:MAG: threonine-phosphate decarboxylase [Rhodospirillaceae bacterium]